MGFFSLKAECGVCGEKVGLNRYQVKMSNSWCCPKCLKKARKGANGQRIIFVQYITIEDLKKLVDDPNLAVKDLPSMKALIK